jgi:hypothetical protein
MDVATVGLHPPGAQEVVARRRNAPHGGRRWLRRETARQLDLSPPLSRRRGGSLWLHPGVSEPDTGSPRGDLCEIRSETAFTRSVGWLRVRSC